MSKTDWRNIAWKCQIAYELAPKWSPMHWLFKWGLWYANRKARSIEGRQ